MKAGDTLAVAFSVNLLMSHWLILPARADSTIGGNRYAARIEIYKQDKQIEHEWIAAIRCLLARTS